MNFAILTMNNIVSNIRKIVNYIVLAINSGVCDFLTAIILFFNFRNFRDTEVLSKSTYKLFLFLREGLQIFKCLYNVIIGC